MNKDLKIIYVILIFAVVAFIILPPLVSASNHRYWKFIQVSMNTLHGPRTCELKWVDGITTVTPNSFTHGGVWLYNEELWDTSFDGETNDVDSGWIMSNTGFITADFGVSGQSFTSFGAYSSYGGGARGANYNLQYSDDNSDWTTFKNWDYNTAATGWFTVDTDLPTDTCTCAGAGNDWEINHSDYCNITDACDLTTGTLSFTGAGITRLNSTIKTTNLGDPGASGILKILSDCLIWIKGT